MYRLVYSVIMLQRKAYHYFFTQTHTIKQLFPCKAALASCNLERQSPVILMRPDSLLRLWRYINHLLTYLLTLGILTGQARNLHILLSEAGR